MPFRDIIQIMPNESDNEAIYYATDETGETLIVTREIICWALRRFYHEDDQGEVQEQEDVAGMVLNFSEIVFADELEHFIAYVNKYEDLDEVQEMLDVCLIKVIEEEKETKTEKKKETLNLVNLGDIRNGRKSKNGKKEKE